MQRAIHLPDGHRALAEQRSRESEARLQAAIDLVKLGLYAWNPQTNELQWDETLKAMWGLPPDAPVDFNVWRAGIHPDDLPRVEAAVQRCSDPRGDGVYDIEYRVIGKSDGIERWIATRGQTNFENNEPVTFYAVALDITDRKRIEQALERRVAQRTEEIATARARIEQIQHELFHASRLAVAGQMAATIAHELSQPLTATLNSLAVARRFCVSDKADRLYDIRELIEDAAQQAERAGSIISRLRHFVLPDSPNRTIEPLRLLLEEAVEFSMVGPDAIGVTLTQRHDPAANAVKVDRIQIQQVVSNLLRNALEAMRNSARRELSITTTQTNEGRVELLVADTGPGVAPEITGQLFDPFVTTKPRGMGLGLSICRTIVAAHGGELRNEPRPDGGTIFRFTVEAGELAG
jgi:PAS domain S-box-containing protein